MFGVRVPPEKLDEARQVLMNAPELADRWIKFLNGERTRHALESRYLVTDGEGAPLAVRWSAEGRWKQGENAATRPATVC